MTGAKSEERDEGWLVLVRHTQVADRYQGVCYGASDVELSPHGISHAGELASELAALAPTHVFHSGLSRAQTLGVQIAAGAGCQPICDRRLAEINFGVWELCPWDDIFAQVGDDMSRIISEPATFAPAGGETAFAVRDRIVSWARELPRDGRVIAVSHGGAIGALRGTLAGNGAQAWQDFMPKNGESIRFPLPVFKDGS